MYNISTNKINVSIDEQRGVISSVVVGGKERCVGSCPIFTARFRDRDGECYYINSTEAKSVKTDSFGLLFEGFEGDFSPLSVKILINASDVIEWRAEVAGVPEKYALEWIELPSVALPRLIENCADGGRIIFPYNEGMIVSNEKLLPRYDMEFPMSGAYFIFPNMVCSQFLAYLFDDVGLYIGAHDSERGFKGIDFYEYENSLVLTIRPYSGVDFGEDYKMLFPVVWQVCDSDWRAACEIYRKWFEANLPSNLVPIKENKALPDWYEKSPLIVTYPVRGIHDMDKMEPNALFPYTNALPILNKIKNATECQIMALLMHWEDTAPWAPPYMWPPFGGEALFNEFRDALHENGDLLGVYCSGFGYTLRSTLIESYNCEKQIERDGVLDGVCHSPANKPELGRTCTPYQRYGYDICPVSKKGKEILQEGFTPIFKSGADYAQILDQNHGGGQYMCYARGHGHPPMPGKWMTEHMQKLLAKWSEDAPNMIFGCESAAAEPFIGGLLMSDNRYELNYPFGLPIPVYAYIYHEYVRNFMGNQCGCPFEPYVDTLRYRLAYSFSIGDVMTLVLSPNGDLMTHWGTHDFEHAPDMEKTLEFIKNVSRLYRDGAKEYLYSGKMTCAPEIECEKITIPLFRGQKTVSVPCILSSAWEAEDGKSAYIVLNPEDAFVDFKIGNESYTVAPLDGMLIIR